MTEPIVNRVAQSSLITLDPVDYMPRIEVMSFDIKDFLFREMVLREKEFRQQLKEHDWTPYAEKAVAVFCSSEALLPTWAYMLISQYLQEARKVFIGNTENLLSALVDEHISNIDFSQYDGAKVILKGCGDEEVPPSVYSALSVALLPRVSSLMFGEACSAVPVYKKKK